MCVYMAGRCYCEDNSKLHFGSKYAIEIGASIAVKGHNMQRRLLFPYKYKKNKKKLNF